MITETHYLKVNTNNALRVAFDVGKTNLDLYFKIMAPNARSFNASTNRILNQTDAILNTLDELSQVAKFNGFSQLFIVCESTGPYSDKLLRLARQKGHLTAYVSGEAVYKAKVIENNDSGKTDTKDPRVIDMLASMDKVLIHRPLEGHYLTLRELNRAYNTERIQMTSEKCQCHGILNRLFSDLDFCSAFTYQVTGKTLFKFFKFNPYRIVRIGYDAFKKIMRKNTKGIHKDTIEKLWKNAESSSRLVLEEGYLDAIECRLEGVWTRFLECEKRLKMIETKMMDLYDALVLEGEFLPKPEKHFLSKFRIARILGETGPLKDFRNEESIIKYSGLNLRERKSGQFTGQVHLSKKGRSTLRAILGECAFGLIRKGYAFGDYYHFKKAKGMNGTKILVAVERKLLSAFFALGTKDVAFDLNRLNQCESKMKKAA